MKRLHKTIGIILLAIILILCLLWIICSWVNNDSENYINDSFEIENIPYVSHDYEEPGLYDAKVIKHISEGDSNSDLGYEVVCSAGTLIGDVDGSGFVNSEDALIIGNIFLGIVGEPSDFCCVDVDQDGKITNNDVLEVMNIFTGKIPSPGVCVSSTIVTCVSGQRIGDVNNDGIISALDSLLVQNIFLQQIPRPSNICCVDLNLDGIVNSIDAQTITDIYTNIIPPLGNCN